MLTLIYEAYNGNNRSFVGTQEEILEFVHKYNKEIISINTCNN